MPVYRNCICTKEEKSMKNKSKKILSTLLAVMMVFGLFAAMPLTASAADPVCSIGSVQYDNLDAALAAVPTGGTSPTVIKLLADITPTAIATISNKKITFDLNGKNLILTDNLVIQADSHVDYTGSGKFEVKRFVTSAGNGGSSNGVFVSGGSTCRLTGVSMVIFAAGSDRSAYGVYCQSGSTVTVDGNVSAKSNGAPGSKGIGIRAINNGSTVTVNGTITADTTYVQFDGTSKSETDKTVPTTKPGYFEYTDGKSVVWVKEPSATVSPTAVTFEKGNSGDITLTVDTGGHIAQSIKNGSYTLQAGTDFVITSITAMTLKAAYLNTLAVGTHTLTFNFSGGTSPTLTITVTEPAVAPTITGPTTMTLNTGYTATSTGVYTISGTPAPTVSKTSGDSKITWNDSTKKLDIAAGLTVGTYPVVLTATSGANTETLTFTLTVSAAGAPSMANFVKTKTYTSGMFSDVDENLWYGNTQQKVIANAYEYGLMQGSGGNMFNPTGNMTLAEAVTIAARVHHIYNGGDGVFTQGSTWYQVYVDYCIANDIIGAGTFSDYNKAATRAEMAYIFSRALPNSEFASQNTVNSLPDVNSSTPYYSAILMLYKAGVVAGSDAQGTFNPANNITRAEAAAIISRVILPTTRFSGKTF